MEYTSSNSEDRQYAKHSDMGGIDIGTANLSRFSFFSWLVHEIIKGGFHTQIRKKLGSFILENLVRFASDNIVYSRNGLES